MSNTTTMENNVNYRPSRNKPPIYTSDKRAKFTQRANKKWIRLATVAGYMISVSTPAVILSIYYVFFWDPQYIISAKKNDNETTTEGPTTEPPGKMKRHADMELELNVLEKRYAEKLPATAYSKSISQSQKDSDQGQFPDQQGYSVPENPGNSGAGLNSEKFVESPQCLPCICPAGQKKSSSSEIRLEEILSGALDNSFDQENANSENTKGR